VTSPDTRARWNSSQNTGWGVAILNRSDAAMLVERSSGRSYAGTKTISPDYCKGRFRGLASQPRASGFRGSTLKVNFSVR
jgi:hypothetical protein